MTELTPEIIQRGRGADPAAVARRRRASVELRAVRERLTSMTGLVRVFDDELLRMFAEAQLNSAVPMMLLVVAVSLATVIWVPMDQVLLWATVATTTTSAMGIVCRRFQRMAVDQRDPSTWRRVFILVSLLQGMSWSYLVVMLLGSPGTIPGAETFLLFVALLITGVMVMLASNLPLAVYAGILPISGVILGTITANHRIEWVTMSAMAIAGQFYFGVLANRLYTTTISSIEARAEKDALIAELEEAKANSDEARRRAEEANVAKSHFLATMSHELRTPLNAILGFSEVMKSELFGQHQVPAYREYANDIHASGTLLLDIINEILDLSRIEAGRYELKEEAVQLAHVVEDCRHMLQMRARSRGIAIREVIEKDLPKLWADERAVRQIALNILSNAIKFTPTGGEIVIKVGWTKAGGQYLSVRDNGPGIPEEEIPVVLQSFGRGSLAIKTAEQGTGLGLPIVKGLIDLHGGTLKLDSVLRQGTEVLVTFPASRVMDTLAPVSDGQSGDGKPEAPVSLRRDKRAA